jgi:8-oxo-dGTP pyrophosphatase MutT (NUDIX family)
MIHYNLLAFNGRTAQTQPKMELYCNNCGKNGHMYNQCKIPITSFGVIAFRVNPSNGEHEYLMIRRKDTLGYIDFMRGKYSNNNKHYLLNMITQMTNQEKELLRTGDFNLMWRKLWGSNAFLNKYKTEEISSKEKYDMLFSGIITKNESYNMNDLIEETERGETWTEPEWGFPKGRRNYQENDYQCAIREFCEETGYSSSMLKNIQNIFPFEEIFIGSNYKSYKHKYYLMFMDYAESCSATPKFQHYEVSKLEWKTYDNCIASIRSYNLEKKKVIANIHTTLHKYKLFNS